MYSQSNTPEEVDDIKRAYLKYAKRILSFGCETFKVRVCWPLIFQGKQLTGLQNEGKMALPIELELAVNCHGLHLCEYASKVFVGLHWK